MARSRYRFRELRGAGRPVGAVLVGLGIALIATTLAAAAWDAVAPSASLPRGGAAGCLVAAALAMVMGAALWAAGTRRERPSLSRREALLAVTLIWVGAGVAGGLPFVLAGALSPVDALFESVSGLTTTGATTVGDIEARLSRPLLLWRSMLQWLGGMGIVVLFVAVFPSLGASGKHLYRGEAPGARVEGLRPRIAETSLVLWKIYVSLTAALLGILLVLGVEPFEALCHALTTLATGGFSTRDGSVGALERPAVEWVIAIFMLLAGTNYGLHYAAFRARSLRVFGRSVELRTYGAIVLVATIALTFMNLARHGEAHRALRDAFFLVATNVSSTGFGTDDYTALPGAGVGIIVLLMMVGGCAGSTAGGIKVERIVIMAKQTAAQVRRSYEPAVVQVVRMGRAVLDRPVVADVMSFFVVYMVCLGVGVMALAATDGLPLPTAFGAILTSLSNMGPVPFHEMAGHADNFTQYSPAAKLVCALAMVVGRLEFFTFFALLIPGFWRR